MTFLNSETVVEDIVSEITLDDIYAAVMDLSTDLSGLRNQVSVLQEEVVKLQELVSEKFDMLQETLHNMPQYEQMEIVIAFLLILVCFEFIRLVKNWTSSFRLRGGR